MQGKQCCILGECILPPEDVRKLTGQLTQTLERLIHRGVLSFHLRFGGEFNRLALDAVVKLREQYPAIQVIISTKRDPHERRFTLEHSDYCVCYLRRRYGPLRNEFKYTDVSKVEIINLGELL